MKKKCPISLVIMTGNNTRHKYFANKLIEVFDVKGVVSETKRAPSQTDNAEDERLIEEHFEERERKELHYFPNNDSFNLSQDVMLRVPMGESNSRRAFNFVAAKKPNFVVLFGTSIIRDPLLSHLDKRMMNIHLGLSPYYRGSGTNFWPLVNNEPECVGATIHLAVLKVDAGPILCQVRPERLSITDNVHDIGCKTIIAGTEAMIKCIKAYHEGKIVPREQKQGGLLYKLKDFNIQALLKLRSNFKKGMLEEYLDKKNERDALKPIIELK
ncbi:formyl transferase [Patescibacteria group bacterium]|nr:formyl transferase [Patescibacteria group bacterium]